MTKMINKEIIEKRTKNFLWYWNINSSIWFLWMEEGFWGTIEELKIRFKSSENKNIIDVYHDMINVSDHIKRFVPNAPIQKTLSKLILIYLTLKGKNNISNEDIREIQTNVFGRINSDTCNLELMPLPCRSVNEKDWIYKDFNIPWLWSRKEYIQIFMPQRICLFQKLIHEKKPKIIIFYSFSYKDKRDLIIWKPTQKIGNLFFYKGVYTKFFIVPHPTAHWLTKNDWHKIAEDIKYISNK